MDRVDWSKTCLVLRHFDEGGRKRRQVRWIAPDATNAKDPLSAGLPRSAVLRCWVAGHAGPEPPVCFCYRSRGGDQQRFQPPGAPVPVSGRVRDSVPGALAVRKRTGSPRTPGALHQRGHDYLPDRSPTYRESGRTGSLSGGHSEFNSRSYGHLSAGQSDRYPSSDRRHDGATRQALWGSGLR